MTGETSRFVALVVQATRATRVLEIGTGTGETALAIAAALPTGGMLITLERDRDAAATARETLAAAGYAAKVSVMIGDASRYLHKIAGPFDVVFHDGDVAQYKSLHERLVHLLAPSSTLITHNVTRAGDYNEVITADPRLRTMFLTLGDGVALSVRRE